MVAARLFSLATIATVAAWVKAQSCNSVLAGQLVASKTRFNTNAYENVSISSGNPTHILTQYTKDINFIFYPADTSISAIKFRFDSSGWNTDNAAPFWMCDSLSDGYVLPCTDNNPTPGWNDLGNHTITVATKNGKECADFYIQVVDSLPTYTRLKQFVPSWFTQENQCVCRDFNSDWCGTSNKVSQCQQLTTAEDCEGVSQCDWIGESSWIHAPTDSIVIGYNGRPKVVETKVHNNYTFHSIQGYGLANTLILETNTSLIVLDTMGSVNTGSQVISIVSTMGKPVSAIIVTHGHTDHIGGLGVYASAFPNAEIYLNERYRTFFEDEATHGQMNYYRASRQFASLFTDELTFSDFGPNNMYYNTPLTQATYLSFEEPGSFENGIPPNLADSLAANITVTIDSVTIEFHSAISESPDEIFVYIPDADTVFSADIYYASFPNLYALRGQGRDPVPWAFSIDKIRALQPTLMVPSHGPMVTSSISSKLQDTRDALQYMNDFVLRRVNNDVRSEKILDDFDLPPALKSQEYLKFSYGSQDHQVTGVLNHYRGWFSGDVVDVAPVTGAARGRMFLKMYSSVSSLASIIDTLVAANTKDELQFALEIVASLRSLPDDERAVFPNDLNYMYVELLYRCAYVQTSYSARNYYLTVAAEAVGAVTNGFTQTALGSAISVLPMNNFIHTFLHSVFPSDQFNYTESFLLKVANTDSTVTEFTINFRNGVMETLTNAPASLQSPTAAVVQLSIQVFKGIILGQVNTVSAFSTGNIYSTQADFVRFAGFLQKLAIKTDL